MLNTIKLKRLINKSLKNKKLTETQLFNRKNLFNKYKRTIIKEKEWTNKQFNQWSKIQINKWYLKKGNK